MGVHRTWLLVALLGFFARAVHADEPPVMPHRIWFPGFGGLCDGGSHVCTWIDSSAFNARVDLILSTSTDRRGFAFVAPYGFSFAIGERLEGGIFSHTAVWTQRVNGNEERLWHQGPLRFWVKGLLWPWRKEPHQRFAVAASFEQEARLPRFDGPNQLGLLTELAALRVSLNKPIWLVDLGLQVGALWDWQGRFGTIEIGPRVGFHLPFMPDTKIFAEALVRGGLTYVRRDVLLPGALDLGNQVPPSAILNFGVVARPKRQVDFGMVLSVGFGDAAPFMLTLRGPLDFSMGKGYPYPQSLVVDILRETGRWIAEQVRKLPEPMQQTCVLYGRDGQPIATLGTLTADGEHCEFQGHRFRLGDNLYPDPAQRRVCLDPQGTRCVQAARPIAGSAPPPGQPPGPLLPPQPGSPSNPSGIPPASGLDPATAQQLAANQGILGTIPTPPVRGQLDDQCILNEGHQQVSPVGHKSADGKHCVVERDVVNPKNGKKIRTEKQKIPVGQPVYRDPSTGRVCLHPNSRNKKDCPVALDPEHNRPLTPGERAGYHGAIGLGRKVDKYVDTAKAGVELLTDPAKLSTAAREAEDRAERAAKGAVETLKDPNKAKEAARDAINSTVDAARGGWQAAKDWWNKPSEKKLDDLAEAGGGGLLSVPVNMATGAAVGGVLRTGETALDVADDLKKAEQAARKGKQAVHALDEAEHAVPVVPKGGTYLLKDPETGQVMRTGRTNDHDRRRGEHKRHQDTKDLDFKPMSKTDDYAAKRGHEQLLHDQHQPPLNKIRPIDPKNPNRDKYMDAARQQLQDHEKD